jgi:hypothetical protein
MIRWRLATIAVLVACVLARPAAQQDIGELDLLLEKLGRYLDAYEGQLAGVVADERYEQQQITVFRRNRVVTENVEDRKLDCEMTFLLGPDEPRWAGVRDVRRVDGHPVHSQAMRLDDLVQSRDQRRRAEDAAKIVGASSAHNLGGARTINLPTTPLEILRIDQHPRFIFKLRGRDKIDGTATAKLDFEEFDEPTLINSMDGVPLFIRGTAWVQPENGRLWRVQLRVRPKVRAGQPPSLDNRLRVDFAPYPAWDVMLPKEMIEDFVVLSGRGSGRARYSNFRRYTSAAAKNPPTRR